MTVLSWKYQNSHWSLILIFQTYSDKEKIPQKVYDNINKYAYIYIYIYIYIIKMRLL